MGYTLCHDDVIKSKLFPRYLPFVWGIHRSRVNSSHKGQWRGVLMLSLICALNKRLSKQSWGWWFETPSRSLSRHCSNGLQKSTCALHCGDTYDTYIDLWSKEIIFFQISQTIKILSLSLANCKLVTQASSLQFLCDSTKYNSSD